MPRADIFRTILCPVDFSEHSRQALRYASLLAARSHGRLIVVYVSDPLLDLAASVAYDEKTMAAKTRGELGRFAERTVAPHRRKIASLTIDVAVGKPDREIEWTADRLGCDLIVMGAQGLTGATRMMLGSTTHRMLRRSPIPVLAVPPFKRGASSRPSNRWPGPTVLAPLDLEAGSQAQAAAAARIAAGLGAKLQLIHVVEPSRMPQWMKVDAYRIDRGRLSRARARLEKLGATLDPALVTECRVVAGDPANQIAAAAAGSAAGLVVLTRRRGQGLFGPRRGSITYQVLSRANTPILALPGDTRWIRRSRKRG